MCACVYSRMIYIPLGIYLIMELLGYLVFLVLDPWGIATLSSTMIELIYTPTNSVKAFLFTLYPLQYLLSSYFLMIAILTGERWNLSVVLICISLITGDDKLFFICSLASYLSSLKTVHIFRPLLNGLVCFFLVNLFYFFVDSGY